LKPWVEKSGYEMLVVYRLRKGQATADETHPFSLKSALLDGEFASPPSPPETQKSLQAKNRRLFH